MSQALPPIQPLLLSVKQGGIGYHFYSLWYDSAGDRTRNLPISGRTLNYKATEPIHSWKKLNVILIQNVAKKVEKVTKKVATGYKKVAKSGKNSQSLDLKKEKNIFSPSFLSVILGAILVWWATTVNECRGNPVSLTWTVCSSVSRPSLRTL